MSEIIEQIGKLKAERAEHVQRIGAIDEHLAQIAQAVGVAPMSIPTPTPDQPAKPTRRPRKPKTAPEAPADSAAPTSDEKPAPVKILDGPSAGRWRNPGSVMTWATEAEARKAAE